MLCVCGPSILEVMPVETERSITAATGLVAVLGHPVAHSLSPRMHNAAFRAQNVDMVYLAFDVHPDRLDEALTGLRALGARGANVTVPHKEAVVSLMDVVSPAAARIGAVNTIVNDQGCLVGHNTDVAGFLKALHSVRPEGAEGMRCLVAGAGGAARAVVAALVEDRAAAIWVHNRTRERAVSLCEAAQIWGAALCEVVAPADLAALGGEVDLLVNTTSVGLSPTVKESAIPVDILDSRHVVVDVVYGPHQTSLVEAAAARGAVALDGREMLVMQAADSYRLWTGLEPPVQAMRQSLEEPER
jgi:shikimate dehydrogenase